MGETPIEVGKRIRELREEAGLSLQEFAEKTGYSSALLSQFENHLISPPLGALVKLSQALGIDVGDFLGDSPTEPFALVRSYERKTVSRVASRTGVNLGYTYEALGIGMKDRRMEPFVVTLEPVAIKEKRLSTHEGEEFIYVLEGDVEVHLEDHTDTLEPGDSIYFKSSIPHHIMCPGEEPARILAVIFTGSEPSSD
jgi:transcriptional regulator with XRE-family HTH domain